MSNLLFFSRSCAYRHAARTELRNARMLPRGPLRNPVLKRARALRDLARNEAWLEGRSFRTHRNIARLAIAVAQPIGLAHAVGWIARPAAKEAPEPWLPAEAASPSVAPLGLVRP